MIVKSNIKYIRKAIDWKHMYYMYLRTLSIVSLINNSATFPCFENAINLNALNEKQILDEIGEVLVKARLCHYSTKTTTVIILISILI